MCYVERGRRHRGDVMRKGQIASKVKLATGQRIAGWILQKQLFCLPCPKVATQGASHMSSCASALSDHSPTWISHALLRYQAGGAYAHSVACITEYLDTFQRLFL